MSNVFKYITRLQGSRVLVIGGTSGIGLCVAEAAVEHGAVVTISGSRKAKLDNALAHLATIRSPLSSSSVEDKISFPTGHICDLKDPAHQEANLTALLEFATDSGARKLDHIVFTAGDEIEIPSLNSVVAEQVHAIQNVRILAPIIVAKLAPRYVTEESNSSLTLTGGSQALRPNKDWAILAGVMSAVSGLVRGFAVDLQPIRVNAIIVGAVKSTAASEMDAALLEEKMAQFRMTTLTNSVGTPQEVAEAYLYCMKSTYATGTTVVTDGGKLLT